MNKDFHQPPAQCVLSLNMKQKPTLKIQNAFAIWSACEKNLLKLSARVEVSSVESNETTAATVSCDLAPPPQRRRRRHPPPPHHVTFLSLHYHTAATHDAIISVEILRYSPFFPSPNHRPSKDTTALATGLFRCRNHSAFLSVSLRECYCAFTARRCWRIPLHCDQ